MSQKKVTKQPLILAIDTSCDETSVAVTRGTMILSNVVASQVELHRPYGGVFPTVAKLAHQENVAPALAKALKQAHVSPQELDGVAVTIGPGLAPALEVGIHAAHEFANLHQLPLIPANHLEGHIVSVLAKPQPNKASQANSSIATTDVHTLSLPVLAIIVSGGNTLFVKVEKQTSHRSSISIKLSNHHTKFERQPHLQLDTPANQTSWQPSFRYTILGRTLDDAAGECLDKVGRMLNLGYPAGPIIEQFARLGNPNCYPFPLPLTQTKTYDMSFSGIKTHSRNLLTQLGGIEQLSKQDIFDFSASLQQAVFRHITYKMEKLLQTNLEEKPYHAVWLSGGVAANVALRKALRRSLKHISRLQTSDPLPLLTPYTKKLCGDNAAMIGVPCFLNLGTPHLPHSIKK